MEWPFFDLRISSGAVLMRGVTDDDVESLLAVLPDDLDHDPRLVPFLPTAADRRRILGAEIWKHRGAWSPGSWCLDLAVEVDGRVVGLQGVEGEEFPLVRTVDSFSWLATEVRGRGHATDMRAGALALAFGHLDAVAAVTSAEVGNAPSLAVSRRLGYVDNGVSRISSQAGVIDLQHLRLTRDDWVASGRTAVVEGFEPCRPWFGLS